jgi:antitoxin component YwqK of YwqJK toxin-antitoxin module
MIRKYGTINEEVNRIKSLFGESRLYGNLVEQSDEIDNSNSIVCTESGCKGEYSGVEHNTDVKPSDVAHQFSNTMSTDVGNKLKELYGKGIYVKVDFDGIEMTTEGMDQKDDVVYKLNIPFKKVDEKCKAMTSFDHVGGWGHSPKLEARKGELSGALLSGDELDISELKKTTEGLEEYWIQWRNKNTQLECEDIEEVEGERKESFHDNGKLKEVYTIVGGKREGPIKQYGDDGVLEYEGNYVNGRIDGEYKTYDPGSGKIADIGQARDGETHGVQRGYVDGVLNSVDIWSDGDIVCEVSEEDINKSDSEILKLQNTYRKIDPDTYEKESDDEYNARMSSEEETVNQTDTNGKKTGVWETKHKNGKIKERGEYDNNKRVGEWEFYDKSGKLTTTGEYVNGIAEGKWIQYNTWNGVEMTTKFKNGKQIITLDVDIKEEDIIRDYKNKKYNIGKFVYDKKNDEFKIKSKYPFLLKRTNGVVENMRTTFWETLSKWYDYPLTANNTSLEVVNNKKFKVTTK